MATFLYRLGRFAFRHRFGVTVAWVALLILAGVGASTATPAAPSSFSVPGTEAQQAVDLLEERFPGADADGATARVVFKAPDGHKLAEPASRALMNKTLAALEQSSDQVASVTTPLTEGTVSKDGSTAYASVAYKASATELSEQTKDALLATVERARTGGLSVEVGGSPVQPAEEGSGAEVLGIAIAAVVLVVTFGSLVAAGLPLLTALLGVGIGVSMIGVLAHAFDLGDTTSSLALMLGLAVGIDYALFIVTRYRSELAEGRDREEAAGRATGTAGSAVVFAGLTVVIALAGLSVVGVPVLTKMGLAAAATVALAVLVALTLLPALLAMAGKRIVGRRARRKPVRRASVKPSGGARWAHFVLRRPVLVLVTSVIGLGALAVPAASLKLGLPDEGAMATDTTQRKAYDLIAAEFGPGVNGPLTVVVDAGSSDDPRRAARRVATTVRGLDGVASVGPATFNEADDTAVITVVPSTEPGSAATEHLVRTIRDSGTDLKEITGARALVTGQTGMKVDFSEKINGALLPYLGITVGLAFLLLMLVFRSLFVPIKAAAGFLLSIGAALGAVVAVFQWGWLADVLGIDQTGPIVSTMPIFMVGIVFGLAMDYEVFLVTRMREAYAAGETPHQAIITGFRHGGRVVTAAAVIMTAVFGSFIASGEQSVKMIGFGLAVAVLLDAFVVRMAIVPALLALFGNAAWWLPTWLHRSLPDLDVEGAKLNSTRGTVAATNVPLPDTQGEMTRL
ncbi:MMPL family transporter [Streptomyces sp. AS58]|uniref:MMPL family transporter n=1 Tax=Streptomyces sp. AS58 TaxID=1519489 RepID=UPI0006AEA3AF|nr:MMPL family transporter [Streptomyces sp. AS58]